MDNTSKMLQSQRQLIGELRTELAALEALVREMGKVVDPVARGLHVASGVVHVNGTYADIAQEILNRPQVKAIIEKQP